MLNGFKLVRENAACAGSEDQPVFISKRAKDKSKKQLESSFFRGGIIEGSPEQEYCRPEMVGASFDSGPGCVVGIWLALRWKPSNGRVNSTSIACGVPCGQKRWDVKTLSDDGVGCVDFRPKPTTILWLISPPRPERVSDHARIRPAECQVWEVTGKLLAFKMEDDGDFHIILEDLTQPKTTMVVEIPDTACQGACAGSHETEMAQARAIFIRTFGLPTQRFHIVQETTLVTVTGVAFFDFKHGQRGVAANGIELHPVIGFKLGT
jgi:hypothetical protein